VRTGPFAWRCDASRQIENFTDFGHFAFVHEGLLGDPAQAVVAPYSVHSAGPSSTRTSAWSSGSAHTRCPSTSAPNCI
jgi:phenylpropionate dioxygenase-like ring-hydroxylating dioxygenase large terminal subunit